jgi:hypothetical protein
MYNNSALAAGGHKEMSSILADQYLGWRRSPPDFQRQQGRRQEADGGPGQRRRGRRASKQENKAGVDHASPCARQKKGRGSWAAANFAA